LLVETDLEGAREAADRARDLSPFSPEVKELERRIRKAESRPRATP
jgi:hypothetical protein